MNIYILSKIFKLVFTLLTLLPYLLYKYNNNNNNNNTIIQYKNIKYKTKKFLKVSKVDILPYLHLTYLLIPLFYIINKINNN